MWRGQKGEGGRKGLCGGVGALEHGWKAKKASLATHAHYFIFTLSYFNNIMCSLVTRQAYSRRSITSLSMYTIRAYVVAIQPLSLPRP